MLEVNEKVRIDYKKLRVTVDILNNTYKDFYSTFSPFEDYKADVSIFNPATCSSTGMEVKGISTKKGSIQNNPYWGTTACRTDEWRWCESATTQEEFWADTTPAPDLGDTPVWIINATDKFGNRENAKLSKMLKEGQGLIYLAEDGLLLFSPKKFKEAIIGFGWQYLTHTEKFSDKSKRFEQKAIIDLSKGTFIPWNNIPKEILK